MNCSVGQESRMPVLGTTREQPTAKAELKDCPAFTENHESHTHGRGGKEGLKLGTLLGKFKALPRTQGQGSPQILCGAHVGTSGLLTQLEGSNLLLLGSKKQRAHPRNYKACAYSYEQQGS